MYGLFSILSRRLSVFSIFNAIAVCEEEKKAQNEMMAIYLTPNSQAMVNKHLAAKGIKDPKVSFISINSVANEDDVYVFKPLFGSRAAFRLKGLVFLDNGNAIGIGRVSNMIGDVKDLEIEAAMPVWSEAKAPDSKDMQTLADLPTRLNQIPGAFQKSLWKGRIPAGRVRNNNYESVHAQLVRFPFDKQIVIDGYICSSLCVNEEGKCEFEPITAKESISQHSNQVTNNTEPEITGDSEQIESSHTPEEDSSECPICRYIKKGPCREDYRVWDECIKSISDSEKLHDCYNATSTMMKCMRKYEYYDIMVAGTDFERLDALQTQSSEAAANKK